MAGHVFIRTLGGLRPADDFAQAALDKIAKGEAVMVEIKRARNLMHHRKLWALCQAVRDNSEGWRSAEDVMTALKFATGHVTKLRLPSMDTVLEVPASISFAAMDQGAFEKFYDLCIDVILSRWLPGVTSEQLRTEIEGMIA